MKKGAGEFTGNSDGESFGNSEWNMDGVESSIGNDNIGESAPVLSEQERSEQADSLADKARRIARGSSDGNLAEGPIINEEKVQEAKELGMREKKQELLREAREAVEVDDEFGASANATERDGRRIEYLLERIDNTRERLGESTDEASAHYKGGPKLSKLFARAGQRKERLNLQEYQSELMNRYGIDYSNYSEKQVKRNAEAMIRNGETPGYRNWGHATNFEKLKILTSGDNGEDIKRQLKRAGYNNLPSSMDDANFTIYEVGKMASFAEQIYLESGN